MDVTQEVVGREGVTYTYVLHWIVLYEVTAHIRGFDGLWYIILATQP